MEALSDWLTETGFPGLIAAAGLLFLVVATFAQAQTRWVSFHLTRFQRALAFLIGVGLVLLSAWLFSEPPTATDSGELSVPPPPRGTPQAAEDLKDWPENTTIEALEKKVAALSENQYRILLSVEQNEGADFDELARRSNWKDSISEFNHRLSRLEDEGLVAYKGLGISLSIELKKCLRESGLKGLKAIRNEAEGLNTTGESVEPSAQAAGQRKMVALYSCNGVVSFADECSAGPREHIGYAVSTAEDDTLVVWRVTDGNFENYGTNDQSHQGPTRLVGSLSSLRGLTPIYQIVGGKNIGNPRGVCHQWNGVLVVDRQKLKPRECPPAEPYGYTYSEAK